MTNADDALAAAEEAEAEAAEAEAVAAAARARARAIRLRREAAAAAATVVADTDTDTDADAAEVTEAVDTTEAVASEPDTPPVFTSTTADAESADTDTEAAGTDAVDGDEPEADEVVKKAVAPKRRRVRIGPRVWKIAAAAVVVIVALALVGLTGAMVVAHRNVETKQRHSAEYAAAARQGVVTLMSLDFNKAKEDVQRILDNTTGDFRKDFEGQAEDFIRVAQESKVVTEATVNAVAVQRMDDNTATVLVAVVTRVSNVASEKQDPRSWRLAVDVARDGDQIKLAKVEFVP